MRERERETWNWEINNIRDEIATVSNAFSARTVGLLVIWQRSTRRSTEGAED
jgi:hypothetical protein